MKKYEDKTVEEQITDFDEVIYFLGECSETNALAAILMEELGRARKLVKCRQALESFLKQLGIDTDKEQDDD
nr:MAG TPA: hypothetical protein [Herelleviridae sp.]